MDAIREVQRVLCTGFNGVGTCRCIPIREVSSFQKVLRLLTIIVITLV